MTFREENSWSYLSERILLISLLTQLLKNDNKQKFTRSDTKLSHKLQKKMSKKEFEFKKENINLCKSHKWLVWSLVATEEDEGILKKGRQKGKKKKKSASCW